MLRYIRCFNEARRRKQYRLIAKEKKRLYETGVDVEVVRLLCRHMANPRNSKAEKRFWNYLHKLPNLP
jgi:phosphopantetheinyl transferase